MPYPIYCCAKSIGVNENSLRISCIVPFSFNFPDAVFCSILMIFHLANKKYLAIHLAISAVISVVEKKYLIMTHA